MKVLYLGVANPVSIRVDGKLCKNYSISLADAAIIKKDDCQYEIIPRAWGLATVFILDMKGAAIDSVIFRVKRIPDPVAKLAGKLNETTRNLSLPNAGIAAVLEGFDFDARFEVTGYDVVIERKGEILFAGKNSTGNAYFGEEVKKAISKMKLGDRFTVKNVLAKGPDGYTRVLNDISFIAR